MSMHLNTHYRHVFDLAIVSTATLATIVLLISSIDVSATTMPRENNVDYLGGDYNSFVPKRGAVDVCRKACSQDKRCVAYTFARPSKESPRGKCYLKTKIGKRRADKCCISEIMDDRTAKKDGGQSVSGGPRVDRPRTDAGAGVRQNTRRTLNLLGHLPRQVWNIEGRTFSRDQRFQNIPLRPASRPRIGPVQQACPTPTDRLNRRKTEFCTCLSAQANQAGNDGFLDAIRTCTQQAEAAQQQYEHWLKHGGPADDADGDGVDSVCAGGSDCDDSDQDRFPGNPEVFDVDHKDEDCDPTTIGGPSADRDGDGFLNEEACNFDGTALVCGTDCNDNDPTVRPTSSEVCDGKDNDCDGDVDEGVSRLFYADTDGDRFGDPHGQTMPRCHAAPGWVENRTDCNDRRADINPRNRNCPN